MYPKHSNATANRLVAALPGVDRRHFLAGCDSVDLEFASVVIEPRERIRHVYFPTGSFLSLTLPVEGHSDLEVGLVGDEGMVGIPLILDTPVLGLCALVQGPGSALRMPTQTFLRELELSPPLLLHLKRYLSVMMAQLAQSIACHRFHVLEARLARWLLMTRDRAHSDTFSITQESLSFMLGVRRVGITNAAGALQKRKLIIYSRGQLTILDRDGLLAASCACYELDRSAYKRGMRRRPPTNPGRSPSGVGEGAG